MFFLCHVSCPAAGVGTSRRVQDMSREHLGRVPRRFLNLANSLLIIKSEQTQPECLMCCLPRRSITAAVPVWEDWLLEQMGSNLMFTLHWMDTWW